MGPTHFLREKPWGRGCLSVLQAPLFNLKGKVSLFPVPHPELEIRGKGSGEGGGGVAVVQTLR